MRPKNLNPTIIDVKYQRAGFNQLANICVPFSLEFEDKFEDALDFGSCKTRLEKGSRTWLFSNQHSTNCMKIKNRLRDLPAHNTLRFSACDYSACETWFLE